MTNILSTAACSLQLQCSAGRTHSALEGNTAMCGWPSCGVYFALLCSANLYTKFPTMSQNLYTVNNTCSKKEYSLNQHSTTYKILIEEFVFFSEFFMFTFRDMHILILKLELKFGIKWLRIY